MARRRTYPGSIAKRGNSYRVRLCVNGQRQYYTLRDVTKKQAEQFARDKDRELRKQAKRRGAGLPGAIAFSEMIERYEDDTLPTLAESTRVGYAVTLRAFKAFFVQELGDPLIDQVHPDHVDRFLTWRRTHDPDGGKLKRTLSGRTIEKERAVLGRIFRIFEKLGYREGNPVRNTDPPKYDQREPVILTDEQYEALLGACKAKGDFLYLYALVLGESGARCESEALWLRWEDVRLEDGFLWIDSAYKGRRTKSGKGRWVPMTKRLERAMRGHFANYRMKTYNGERTEWVFHHTFQNRMAKAGDRVKCMRRGLLSAAGDAELPDGFVQHDLRHRRVTKWLAEGGSPALVQEAVGHAEITTTMRYSHLSREHLRSLVAQEAESRGKRIHAAHK